MTSKFHFTCNHGLINRVLRSSVCVGQQQQLAYSCCKVETIVGHCIYYRLISLNSSSNFFICSTIILSYYQGSPIATNVKCQWHSSLFVIHIWDTYSSTEKNHLTKRSWHPIWTAGHYTVSQKNCAKSFLSERRQISTNFDNFWQRDGKEAKMMSNALTFHLT